MLRYRCGVAILYREVAAAWFEDRLTKPGHAMRFKVKWRAGGEEPLQPEIFNSENQAKDRVRQLIGQYGEGVTVDIWNEDETWQIVSPAGVREWCEKG